MHDVIKVWVIGSLATAATAASTALGAILAVTNTSNDDLSSTLRALLFVALGFSFLGTLFLVYYTAVYVRNVKSQLLSARTTTWGVFALGVIVGAVSIALPLVSLVWLVSVLNSLDSQILSQKPIVWIAAWFVCTGIALLAQLALFVVLGLWTKRQFRVQSLGRLDIDSGARLSVMQEAAPEEHRSFNSRDTTVAELPRTPSTKRVRTPLRGSDSVRVPASVSRTRLVANNDRSAKSSLDMSPFPAGETASADNAFDRWDTSSVHSEMRAAVGSSPPVTRSGLETIPGSRPDSPEEANTIQGLALPSSPPQAITSDTATALGDWSSSPSRYVPTSSPPSSPPNFSRPTSKQQNKAGPTAPPTPSKQDMIHPLFRASSPHPPPIAIAGTIVTASPMADAPITPRTLANLRNHNKSSSSIYSQFPKPTGHWRAMPSVSQYSERRPSTSGSQGPGSPPPGSPGPSIVDEGELPPILPGFVLSAGQRSSMLGYANRKSIKREKRGSQLSVSTGRQTLARDSRCVWLQEAEGKDFFVCLLDLMVGRRHNGAVRPGPTNHGSRRPSFFEEPWQAGQPMVKVAPWPVASPSALPELTQQRVLCAKMPFVHSCSRRRDRALDHKALPAPRSPAQPASKYSLVMEYFAHTRPSSMRDQPRQKRPGSSRLSCGARPWFLDLSVNHQHHPARRRRDRDFADLAPLKPDSVYSTRRKSLIQPRTQYKFSPASSKTPIVHAIRPISTMARKNSSSSKAVGGLRRPASKPRNGQPIAYPVKDFQIEESPDQNPQVDEKQPDCTPPVEATVAAEIPTTPQPALEASEKDSSGLSTAPSSIGSTPIGLMSPQKPQSATKVGNQSPSKRPLRSRKRSSKAVEGDAHQPPMKKRKTVTPAADKSTTPTATSSQAPAVVATIVEDSLAPNADQESRLADHMASPDIAILSSIEKSPEKSTTMEQQEHIAAPNPPNLRRSGRANAKRKAAEIDETVVRPTPNKKPRQGTDEGYASNSPAVSLSPEAIKATKAEITRDRRFYAQLETELQPQKDGHVEEVWTKFDRKKVIMYGADAKTQYTPAHAEATRRGGRGGGRGTARGGRGGAGNGRGRGGRARGKARDEDSPEPPPPKRIQTHEDLLTIKHIKARQAELRRFFSVVGGQQSEILDIMSSRDLARMIKKPKAHKQVPEYDELVSDLEAAKTEAEDLARRRYAAEVEAENRRYEAEKELIEQQCNTTIKDLQEEYKKGAQGDLILFRRAIAAAHDETRTQDGSEVDYFPRYHEFPEADAKVRGFTSTHITDEKPFKHHLLTYDDQARREVIDDDVGPTIQAFAQKNAERRAEEERKKTQTMEALSAEADRQLKEMKGYLIPRPMRTEDANSYALSCLADISEWMALKHPDKNYVFMPLEDSDTFPKEALNYDKLSDGGVSAYQHPPPATLPPPPADPAATVPKPVTSKPNSAQGTRRSLRNLQPNGPVSQSQAQMPTAANTTTSTAAVVSSGPGPAIAPAPPKLAPTPSAGPALQPRPPPIDTRPPPITSSEGPSPSQQTAGTQLQSAHGFPPLQPRHASQSSLPPPPPPPYSPYGQHFSPTYPPQTYPPPPQSHHAHTSGPPHPVPPPPSPYRQQPPPSPYGPQQQQQHQPYNPYGPPLSGPLPQAQQPQQQYSFLPPQQGPAPPQYSPQLSRPHSRSRSHASSPSQAPDPFRPSNINGYHGNSHAHSHPHSHTQPQPPQYHQSPQQQQQAHHSQAPIQPPPLQQQQQPPQPHSSGPLPPQQHPYPHHDIHGRSRSHSLNVPHTQGPPPPLPPPAQQLPQPTQHRFGAVLGVNPTPPPSSTITAANAPPAATGAGKTRGRNRSKQPVTFVNQTLATRKAAAEQLAREEAAAAAEKKERKGREKDRERQGK